MFYFHKKIYLSGFLILLILLFGIAGFMIIEGHSLMDAFYMTIITISTVGYGEVQPLSDAGKMFTSALIIGSFSTFAIAITSITNYIVSGEYRKALADQKIRKMLADINDHVIVCGYGRVGKQTVETLMKFNRKIVVIEKIKSNDRPENVLFLQGDATNESLLVKAGVKNANAIISCLSSDADNVFVVLTVRQLNAKLNIISRSSDVNSVKKLKFAGADHVIMPDNVGGQHMAQLVLQPDLVEFIERISDQSEENINLEEVSFNELPENFKNKTIGKLSQTQITGCSIIGYRSPSGEIIVNPSPETEVVPNSKLFVLGRKEQIRKLNALLSNPNSEIFGVKLGE